MALGISLATWYFSDTKLESWLEQNYWSEEGLIMGGAEGRDKSGEALEDVLLQQIEELLKMMATPQVQMVIFSPRDESGEQEIYPFGEHEERVDRSDTGLQFWETLPEGTELQLEVTPGLFQPRSVQIESDTD